MHFSSNPTHLSVPLIHASQHSFRTTLSSGPSLIDWKNGSKTLHLLCGPCTPISFSLTPVNLAAEPPGGNRDCWSEKDRCPWKREKFPRTLCRVSIRKRTLALFHLLSYVKSMLRSQEASICPSSASLLSSLQRRRSAAKAAEMSLWNQAWETAQGIWVNRIGWQCPAHQRQLARKPSLFRKPICFPWKMCAQTWDFALTALFSF